jgi:hypothetical protein
LEPVDGSLQAPHWLELAPARAFLPKALPTRPPFSQKHSPEGHTSVEERSTSMSRFTPDPVSKICDMKTDFPCAFVTTTSRHGKISSVELRVSMLTSEEFLGALG